MSELFFVPLYVCGISLKIVSVLKSVYSLSLSLSLFIYIPFNMNF